MKDKILLLLEQYHEDLTQNRKRKGSKEMVQDFYKIKEEFADNLIQLFSDN
tara:strand:- start:363 stop:515 length:153 start_codon:yes stop_codon:yes gene_type:complete